MLRSCPRRGGDGEGGRKDLGWWWSRAYLCVLQVLTWKSTIVMRGGAPHFAARTDCAVQDSEGFGQTGFWISAGLQWFIWIPVGKRGPRVEFTGDNGPPHSYAGCPRGHGIASMGAVDTGHWTLDSGKYEPRIRHSCEHGWEPTADGSHLRLVSERLDPPALPLPMPRVPAALKGRLALITSAPGRKATVSY